jgi:hypothetical protein
MTKINTKSYPYILAILFAVGGLIYINLIDEKDEQTFNNALKKGKKEMFIGQLKSIELEGLRNKLTFYKEDSSLKIFVVNEINTTEGLQPNEIKGGEWYEILILENSDKIIDMHKAVEGMNIDAVSDLTEKDRSNINEFIKDEFVKDLILSLFTLIVILFSTFKIYKYQKNA